MIVVMIIGVLLNIAAPAFVHTRDSGQARSCIANLHNINMAKEQWAFQSNIPDNYPLNPQWSELSPYVKASTQPTCPTTGQIYDLGLVSAPPTCPYGGPNGVPSLAHVL